MVFIPTDNGYWVDENFSRLAEIIKDYDPYLELRWIPTDKRTREDKKPYVIIDTRINQPVLYASELDSPQEILTKLFEGDNRHGDVLRRLEAANAAKEAFEMKERLEMYEELNDQTAFFVGSNKNYLNFNGKKFDSNRRVIGTTKGKTYL